MIDYTLSVKKKNNTVVAEKYVKEVQVLDVQSKTACAKVKAWWGTDYLLRVKMNDKWIITHILWQSYLMTINGMKNLIFILILLISVCFYSCSNGQSNQIVLSQSTAQWKDDLDQLVIQLPKLHKNAFHTISKEEFQHQVSMLSRKIELLNDDQIITELMRLVALIGDGHTHLDLPQSLDRYPLEIAQFDNEYRVIVTNEKYVDVLGLRLLAIENLPIDTVHKKLTLLVPNGENKDRTLFTSLQYLGSPEILHGLKIIKKKTEVLFTFLNDKGDTVEKNIQPANLRNSSFKMLPNKNIPLMLQNFQQAWWTKYLPEKKAIYFALNAYPNRNIFEIKSEELSRLIDSTNAEKLIIDFRRNQGGDFDLFRSFLLPTFKSKSNLSKKGSIYVITGPATFSASMVNTIDLKNELNAIQVGLPTGARPNSYSEHGDFMLPNSHLRISYSIEYYKFANEADTAVVPDKIIKQNWTQYINGADPCLDWILQE